MSECSGMRLVRLGWCGLEGEGGAEPKMSDRVSEYEGPGGEEWEGM